MSAQASTVLVIGAPGSGKSIFVQELEAQHRAQGAEFVVWDPFGHWGNAPGRTIVPTADAEEAAQEACRRAPTTLILDEAHLAAPSPGGPPKGSALRELIKVGRHPSARGSWPRRGAVALILATQRPTEIWTGIRGVLTRLYAGRFPTSAAASLDWIARATSPEFAQAVTELPKPEPGRPVQFLEWRF